MDQNPQISSEEEDEEEEGGIVTHVYTQITPLWDNLAPLPTGRVTQCWLIGGRQFPQRGVAVGSPSGGWGGVVASARSNCCT